MDILGLVYVEYTNRNENSINPLGKYLCLKYTYKELTTSTS